MKEFFIPVTITIDGLLKVSANTYEEAANIANLNYCELNIDDLQTNRNFNIVNKELEFPDSCFED